MKKDFGKADINETLKWLKKNGFNSLYKALKIVNKKRKLLKNT